MSTQTARAELASPGRPGAPPTWLGYFHLGVLYVVWSTTYLAIAVAVRPGGGFAPWIMGGTRLVAAGILLAAWAALRGQSLRLTRRDAATLLLSGLLLWTGGNGLVNWAEQHAPSGYAAVLVGALPIWTALLESLLNRRLPSARLGAALLVGFAGLVVLNAPTLAAGSRADVMAMLALTVSPVSWATGLLIQRRRPVALSPMAASAYLHFFGASGFLVVAALQREPLPRPDAAALAAWTYLVVFGSLAFTSFVAAVRLLPPALVTTYAYVNPVLAVLLGRIVLGEPVTPSSVLGAGLVLLGVAGVFRGRDGAGETARGETARDRSG